MPSEHHFCVSLGASRCAQGPCDGPQLSNFVTTWSSEKLPEIFENALWAALGWQEVHHPPSIPGPNVLPLAPALSMWIHPEHPGTPPAVSPYSLQLVT